MCYWLILRWGNGFVVYSMEREKNRSRRWCSGEGIRGRRCRLNFISADVLQSMTIQQGGAIKYAFLFGNLHILREMPLEITFKFYLTTQCDKAIWECCVSCSRLVACDRLSFMGGQKEKLPDSRTSSYLRDSPSFLSEFNEFKFTSGSFSETSLEFEDQVTKIPPTPLFKLPPGGPGHFFPNY
ncbi:hypothetical protein BT96DRAFT_970445 [Gymnopus androsaceus JB14]|uniref:Uncharacterized protein n=1 Tax=Gymnopus androsaceus JB14 TaxID=1447944 RepID=A0A6A4IEI9_9AGAR|nr:hypothetical protein BT96DRAFT_970445 [Gymnopus androsaceus JB14]